MAPDLNTVPPSPCDKVQLSNTQTGPSASRQPSMPMGPPAAPISSPTGNIQPPPRDPIVGGDSVTTADNSSVGIGPGKDLRGFGGDFGLTPSIRTASSSATTHCCRVALAARERTRSGSRFRALGLIEWSNAKLVLHLGQSTDTRAIYPSPAVRICCFNHIFYLGRARRFYRPQCKSSAFRS